MKTNRIYIVMRILIAIFIAGPIIIMLIDPKEDVGIFGMLGVFGILAYQIVKWLDGRITALESLVEGGTRED